MVSELKASNGSNQIERADTFVVQPQDSYTAEEEEKKERPRNGKVTYESLISAGSANVHCTINEIKKNSTETVIKMHFKAEEADGKAQVQNNDISTDEDSDVEV